MLPTLHTNEDIATFIPKMAKKDFQSILNFVHSK